MNFEKTTNKKSLLVIIVGLICFVHVDSAFSLNERISFNLDNHSMTEVANKISQQLNYKVFMDDELAPIKVSGQFNDITLDNFLSRRIFRGINIVVLFDDKQHTVTISHLGKKNNHTEYNQTNSKSWTTTGNDENIEITEGILRRDVIAYVSQVNPMDLEVTEGIFRRDVTALPSKVDPMDLEITEGIFRRDVILNTKTTSPSKVEITEGVWRDEYITPEKKISILDLDVDITEGIKRSTVLHL